MIWCWYFELTFRKDDNFSKQRYDRYCVDLVSSERLKMIMEIVHGCVRITSCKWIFNADVHVFRKMTMCDFQAKVTSWIWKKKSLFILEKMVPFWIAMIVNLGPAVQYSVIVWSLFNRRLDVGAEVKFFENFSKLFAWMGRMKIFHLNKMKFKLSGFKLAQIATNEIRSSRKWSGEKMSFAWKFVVLISIHAELFHTWLWFRWNEKQRVSR